MADLIGTTVGRYRIVGSLGRGGMAQVFKAYQPGLNRYVAVKVLHSHLAGDPDFVSRFEREAQAVANLRHQNIVQVFDFDTEKDIHYMAMEFINGPSLKDELRARIEVNKPFHLEETARILAALCDAIDYAHSQGMVHRDLKPGNFMLTDQGQIMVLDFGIAKIIDATTITMSGAVTGTPAYMSPEQGQGERGDKRSDIYSLGVVLHELTTGRVPFDGDTPMAVIFKHISDPLPMPRKVNPAISEALELAILKAMAKDPDDRFQSGADMAQTVLSAINLPSNDSLNRNPVLPIAPPPRITELAPSDATFQVAETPPVPLETTVRPDPVAPAATTLEPAPRQSTSVIIMAIVALLVVVGGIGYLFFGTGSGLSGNSSTLAGAEAIDTPTIDNARTGVSIADTLTPTNTPIPESTTTATAVPATPTNTDVTPIIAPTITDTPELTVTLVSAEAATATSTTLPDTPTREPTATETSTALPSTATVLPTETADINATINALLSVRETEAADAIVEAAFTLTAAVPTATETPISTATPTPTEIILATDTPIPTATPAIPPTETPIPPSPTPLPPPTSAAPAVSGRIAVPVDNGGGGYDTVIYALPSGAQIARIQNVHQPSFRGDSVKMLVNGEGGGRDNVWEINVANWQLERSVSSSPSDFHPDYSPGGDRLVIGNANLAIGADGQPHPYVFVQCGVRDPREESENRCRDIADLGQIVPTGQVGEVHGSNPVWTGNDLIIYKGCNTWQGGNSCGIFQVGSWATKRDSNGVTPAKLPGIDGTDIIPTDAQGSNFLYHNRQNDNWDVYIANTGGGPRNLSNGPTSVDVLGAFSPDGLWAAFVSNRDGTWAIWAVPTSGGVPSRLFDIPWGQPPRDWINERISWGL